MTSVTLGPVELITLVFPGERAQPGVAQVITELATGHEITVLDLVFVTRTSGGLVRITGARENLGDIGLDPLRLGAPEVIGEGDVGVVRDWLPPGTSAAIIAYEHSWAHRLARAVRDAGGVVMLGGSTGRSAEERRAVAESEAAVRQAEAADRAPRR
jgi:hypothetical protein